MAGASSCKYLEREAQRGGSGAVGGGRELRVYRERAALSGLWREGRGLAAEIGAEQREGAARRAERCRGRRRAYGGS